MFIPSVILQLAVVVFLPITTTAQFTTSLLNRNTEPTLKHRDQIQGLNTATAPMGPKPSPTKTSLTSPDTVLAREFGYATPSFIATDCKNSKYHNKVPPNPDWFPADGQGALEGIQYLKTDPNLSKFKWTPSLQGMPGTGPRVCGRVFCDMKTNTSIYWCNSNILPTTLDSPWLIGTAANTLYNDDNCWENRNRIGRPGGRLKGEIWTDSFWSVFIRHEYCWRLQEVNN
ncbi:hypothetical protein SMACR_03733 [Sordaria macrospora]|uniref:WGS project CABT00000000 data, contig 2.16 n=2 Tax=Sordaria macrospora TaxID=5147 RepID=F7VZS8_SORMK|nr:uncharacterized protein SMAC_03733 [Sordaria macrospora k-hell]KAA8629204.1 hypothetical protein SMACR_03733 [Sordaria macrospora]WPJ61630.1 hypothetical protein SMAC4_03733 [Sordaria macrospora]CCC11027.1 unnamed protein product [Sordaria macrospora k-hell]